MKLPNMKGLRKPAAVTLILLLLIIGTAAVYAASSVPGSEGDPVVTKSYVDSAIANAVAGSGGASAGSSYKVVELTEGQALIGGEGTEIILRSGIATAIDNGANGVSDMTAGEDLKTGQKVTENHLLLVPRNDGRGIRVSTGAFVMVRGSYTLQ